MQEAQVQEEQVQGEQPQDQEEQPEDQEERAPEEVTVEEPALAALDATERERLPKAMWDALKRYSRLQSVLSKLQSGLMAAQRQTLASQQRPQRNAHGQLQERRASDGFQQRQGRRAWAESPTKSGAMALSQQASLRASVSLRSIGKNMPAGQLGSPRYRAEPQLDEEQRELLDEVAAQVAAATSCTAGLEGLDRYSLLLSAALQLGLPLPPPPPAVDDDGRVAAQAYKEALAAAENAAG